MGYGNDKIIARTSAIASAIAGTEITYGELKFRYSANAINGNLEIQSATAVAVAIRSYAQEYFPAIGIARNMAYLAGSAPAAGATWLLLLAGGCGSDEQINYEIFTATNVYLVKMFCFSVTNVHIIVQRAI